MEGKVVIKEPLRTDAAPSSALYGASVMWWALAADRHSRASAQRAPCVSAPDPPRGGLGVPDPNLADANKCGQSQCWRPGEDLRSIELISKLSGDIHEFHVEPVWDGQRDVPCTNRHVQRDIPSIELGVGPVEFGRAGSDLHTRVSGYLASAPHDDIAKWRSQSQRLRSSTGGRRQVGNAGCATHDDGECVVGHRLSDLFDEILEVIELEVASCDERAKVVDDLFPRSG